VGQTRFYCTVPINYITRGAQNGSCMQAAASGGAEERQTSSLMAQHAFRVNVRIEFSRCLIKDHTMETYGKLEF
jgi:hypothetical protein